MSPQIHRCDPAKIESYLQHELSAVAEAEFESHLDSCDTCRKRLEQDAADRSCWHEARELLGDSRWRNEPSSGMLCLESMQNKIDTEFKGLVADSSEPHGQPIRSVLAALAPTDRPEMLGRLGTYEISGVIGCGGMGVVLKGFDPSLNRVVAIKVLSPHLATSGAARQRFAREAQAAAAVTHDNVIEIYGVAQADGLPYLVMPYARGPSLQARIDQQGALPLEEVLRIGYQIAAGLTAAHDQGLVHRDIKPANILLSDGIDRLVITDFGLARAVDDASVTKTGVITGTPQYMSPEQARGENIDQRSDLFSLGSVLYALCTGRPPFRAENTYGILRSISDQTPRDIRSLNPAIPAWLCQLIDRLHGKRMDERYESADQVAKLLKQCLAHVQQPSLHPLPASLVPTRRLVDGLSPRVLAGAGVGLALLGLFALVISNPTGQQTGADASLPPETVMAKGWPGQLHYQMQTGQEDAFLLTVSSQLPGIDIQVDGLVVTEVLAVEADRYRIRIQSDLQLLESVASSDEPLAGQVQVLGLGNHWRRWSGNRTSVAVIGKSGELISQQGNLELPYSLASLPELVLPELPAETKSDLLDAPRHLQTDSASTIDHPNTEKTDLTFLSGDAEVVFDAKAGLVRSVRLDRSITITADHVVQRVPIHVELIRITLAERRSWEQGRADTGEENSATPGPLTADEEARLLTDLRNNQRILYWLHHLNRRPVDSFSVDVVDALAALTDHPNDSYRTVAQRLVNKIPTQRLNPFRQVE